MYIIPFTIMFQYYKTENVKVLARAWRITFRLYATLQAAHKANRRFAAACNVAEKTA
jgi:hypothetical protein